MWVDGFFPEIEQPFVGSEGECVCELDGIVVLERDFGEFVSKRNEAVVDVFYGFGCYKLLKSHGALSFLERNIFENCGCDG